MSRLEAMPEKSFLQHLLDKRADVERLGEKTGADVGGALAEVDRQIKQCLQGGDVTKGKGVIKSGKED